VDLKAVAPLKRPLAIGDLRGVKGLEKMVLLQKGSRLSVMAVTEKEFEIVRALGEQ
jgi:predicted RNA-binding protein with PUA-like domain